MRYRSRGKKKPLPRTGKGQALIGSSFPRRSALQARSGAASHSLHAASPATGARNHAAHLPPKFALEKHIPRLLFKAKQFLGRPELFFPEPMPLVPVFFYPVERGPELFGIRLPGLKGNT